MKAGWQTSTLGDVLAVIRNGVNCKQDKSGNGDRISRIESISAATFDLDKVGYAELSERDKERNRLQPGDILFSHINSAVHVGKTAVFDCDEPVYHGVNLLLMRPKEVVTSAYLDHALKYLFQSGYWRGVCKQSVNQASVNQQDISRVEIRYPKSLAEQQRIVGLLDEAFEGLATAKANAEKNLQNARALFESHLQSVFTQRGPGWVEKPLGDLCSIARGGSPRPIQSFLTTASDGFNWVKIGDATASGKYIYTTEQKIIREGATRSRIVHAGDFLLSNSMSFGRPYIMQTTGCVHDGWLVLSDYASQLDQDYLYLVLGSQFMFQQFDRLAAGSTVRNLNIELASRVEVPVPPLKQQRDIAQHLDAISEVTQRLARLYERKHAALAALKKSLLHQAFSGGL